MGAHIGRWEATIEEFARDYRVIAYDHPGFGKSWKDPSVYNIPFLVQTLFEFISALQLKEITIVGHSLGGTVILETLARQHPDIQRAVVIAPAGIRSVHHWLGRLSAGLLLRLGLSAYLIPRAMAGCVVRRTESALDMIYQASHISQDPEWPVLRAGLRKTTEHFLKYSLLGCLHQVKTPLLVVWGEGDTLQPAGQALLLHREIPMARLVLMPRCGHYPQLECPEELHPILRDFFAGKSYIHGCEDH